MAANMVDSSRLLQSLMLIALVGAAAGCGASDHGEQGSSQPQAEAPPAASPELPAAEPVPSPEPQPTEPSVSLTQADVEPADTEPAAQSAADSPASSPTMEPDEAVARAESVEADPPVPPQPTESDMTDPEPAEPEPTASAPTGREPGSASSEPAAGRSNGPRLGHNPLRNGTEGSAGHRPVVVSPASAKSRATAKGESDEEPFDPIKENGPIFAGWPKPKWALVITGRQDGYLEPCGCAGLDRMKGGLSRRLSMFNQLRDDWGAVAGVDVGGLVKGFGPQADLKFQTTMNAMKAMRYDAIAIGKAELQFGESGVGSLISVGTGDDSPFLSTNVALFGFDAGLTSPKRIVDVGGVKLGVASILGAKWQKEINNSDVEMADPREKLAAVVPSLASEADVLILLAHATREESIELARQFPRFDVVVTAGGPPEPPAQPELVDGTRTLLVEVGEKGMNAVVLGFFDDPDRPIRYQRVPLDSRFPQSEILKKEMGLYQDWLKDAGLEGLGVTAVTYPGKELMGKFVGTAKCKSCHEESYMVWKKSGHAKAWQTLVELDPPRNFDPECISCHVVGWSPQNYRPFQSGFLSEKETPHLVDVGCEICHGPGEKHVAAEMGGSFDLQEKLRKPTVLTVEDAQQAVSNAISDRQHCMNCHDLDNSPDFDFDTYWPKIEHREE